MKTKQEIRKYIVNKRKELPDTEVIEKSLKIVEKIFFHPIFLKSEVVYCYKSIQNEVNMDHIINKLLKDNKQVALPRIDHNQMNFFMINTKEDLEKGYFGIYEPKDYCKKADLPDLVLVPGVAFTPDGYRLGYGGGFYDRFLSEINTYSIGIGYAFQIINSLPIEEHDKKLNEIITD